MSFNVFELREIDELLGELDHLLYRMNWGPDDRRRRQCREIQKRIKQLIADEQDPRVVVNHHGDLEEVAPGG